MPNLNDLFLEFDKKISLKKVYKQKITRGRDALRTKISNKFSEKGRNKPKYCTQCSYAMNTAAMPLDGDAFDLDHGIYLQGYSTMQLTWPSTQSVHSWVKEAVNGHTSNPLVHKNTCVRVVYEDKYHIDLPI